MVVVVGCGVDATVKLGVRVLSMNVSEVVEGYRMREVTMGWDEKQTICNTMR